MQVLAQNCRASVFCQSLFKNFDRRVSAFAARFANTRRLKPVALVQIDPAVGVPVAVDEYPTACSSTAGVPQHHAWVCAHADKSSAISASLSQVPHLPGHVERSVKVISILMITIIVTMLMYKRVSGSGRSR